LLNKKLLQLCDIFSKLAAQEPTPDILKKIEDFDTYKDRQDFAEAKLERLGSGSSRITYLTPEKTVIKLAKNDRGLAQNEAEANPDIKSKYFNKVLKSGKDFIWIEAPFLDKITEKEFDELTGINFKDFSEALSYGLREDKSEEKPKGLDKIFQSDIYKDVVNVGKEFKLLPGDLGRPSSWAAKDGHPIVIDLGLSRKIYDLYYDDGSDDSSS